MYSAPPRQQWLAFALILQIKLFIFHIMRLQPGTPLRLILI